MAGELPQAVAGMRARFNALSALPSRFVVSRDEYNAYEAYLEAEQTRRVAEWRAAGSPDDWHALLGIVYLGPHDRLMFKGVELQIG